MRPSSSSTGRMSHPIVIRRTIDYSPFETQTQGFSTIQTASAGFRRF
jgi:hypothetical protein